MLDIVTNEGPIVAISFAFLSIGLALGLGAIVGLIIFVFYWEKTHRLYYKITGKKRPLGYYFKTW